MEANIQALIEHYKRFGYTLSKSEIFEDYDWYYRNRETIDNDKIIKIIQPNGQLYGIQADLTLSAMKNYLNRKQANTKFQKIFYYGNTYENSQDRELLKHKVLGIEFFASEDIIGDLEVIRLAKDSLASFTKPFVLEFSHARLLTTLLDQPQLDEASRALCRDAINHRNFHELQACLIENGCDEAQRQFILKTAALRGDPQTILTALAQLDTNNQLSAVRAELDTLIQALNLLSLNQQLILDLSLQNPQNYYTGLIFQGFLAEVGHSVLRGGRYGSLKSSHSQAFSSVGFTLELDDILIKHYRPDCYDAIVLYETVSANLLTCIEELRQSGKSVLSAPRSQVNDLRLLKERTTQLLTFDESTHTLKELL